METDDELDLASDALDRIAPLIAKYTPKNIHLILSGIPTATDARGYREWQRAGRQVRKGEHGVRIWVPRRDGGHIKRTAAEGEPIARQRFTMTTVFDVAQTDPAAPAQVAAD